MNRGKAGHYNFSQRVKSINKSKIVFKVIVAKTSLTH